MLELHARVAEWQTRRSQKPLSHDVRVRLSPRAPFKTNGPAHAGPFSFPKPIRATGEWRRRPAPGAPWCPCQARFPLPGAYRGRSSRKCGRARCSTAMPIPCVDTRGARCSGTLPAVMPLPSSMTDDDHVVARTHARDADGQLALGRHGVAHGVLHQRLQQERRHHHLVDLGLDVADPAQGGLRRSAPAQT